MVAPGVIFIGPSAPVAEVSSDIELRPPARRGDLISAAREGARVIGLVDGLFHQDLAVTPREVREAAALGTKLIGGGSMGALRACDCPDAMTGIGTIFERFKSGELTADDEVGVVFNPITNEVVAYPLVQIREACVLITRQVPSYRADAEQFVHHMAALPFSDRTPERMRAELRVGSLPWSFVEEALHNPSTDLKRADALLVIRAAVEALRALAGRAH